ncbi:MAG: type I 3-dehydroquinate dehydratase [Candidatus Omnitrophica bacterium CG11_big_fil_rev_8_21_14_0_20_45_26]|uniref:3-dehydroquinate dehydratase n=1 Tax=Candidatus Abzuiibacterium crystallinum TaxID=1974748 RepID=A0A2H0LKN0_9BACT|nr:MAG: type I 3-dehydroquinate dehydratase [Candidatus Omnitrophica bacterium CG11_big_fil_rev_8_21_14_0_20_45_26]PIW63942.1 MAG: type I 3-dehydroquinate dehydratase [Candidatus Omnitrophica bacterium CG12_big_fil_rev_8_21_14_0_65_45_16]
MKPIQIGNTKLGQGPVVCVVLQDSFSASTLRTLKRAGVRMTELRLDQFRHFSLPKFAAKIALLRCFGFSILATIRHPKEGGHFRGSESKRQFLYQMVIPFVDAVDVEMGSVIFNDVLKEAKRQKKTVIASYHNFKRTPAVSFLRRKMRRAKKKGASVVKLAVMMKNKTDFSVMLNFTNDYANQNLITIGMGRAGTPSRTLFPFFGSLLTYGAVKRQSAPGQPTALSLAAQLGLKKKLR